MTIELHAAGEGHLEGLIDAGQYNTDQPWDFSPEDGNALLGENGDDWTRYSGIHLGLDDSAADKTKDRWKYPAAKAKDDGEDVYRSALVAAKKRAAQQGENDIETAAGRLIDRIDRKEGNGGESKDKSASAASPATVLQRGGDLPHLAARIFGAPLLVAPPKLEVILSAIGPRLGGIDQAKIAPSAFAGSDDDGEPDVPPYDVTDDGIALIDVSGTLVYKSSWLKALCGMKSYGETGVSLSTALDDPAVKGILLMVDSYGGEASGVFDLSDAIFEARKKKPICGVAADNADSAAFAILSAAEKVFVSRTSEVGSVGVVCMHQDQSAADKMDGVKYTYIYSGDHKVDGNPHEPLSDTARQSLQAECDRLRTLFAASVARYRGLTADAVLATQAGCFHGEEAVAAKFADAIGTPADALTALRGMIVSGAVTAGTAGPQIVPASPLGAGVGIVPSASVTDKPSASVIDLDAVREKAKGDATAFSLELVELCSLAGRPEMAAEFLRLGVSTSEARKRLQNLRADVSDARRTEGHILPDADDHPAQTATDGWNKAIAKATGINMENGK